MAKPYVDPEYTKQLKAFQAVVNPKPTQEELKQLRIKIEQRQGKSLPPRNTCCKGENHGTKTNCDCTTQRTS